MFTRLVENITVLLTEAEKLIDELDGAAATTDVGKYVVVWKNDAGTWKLHIDIWNTNAA